MNSTPHLIQTTLRIRVDDQGEAQVIRELCLEEPWLEQAGFDSMTKLQITIYPELIFIEPLLPQANDHPNH